VHRSLAVGAIVASLVCTPTMAQRAPGPSPARKTYRYHPAFRVPPSLESVLQYLAAGQDAFPEEKTAEELAGRLTQLSGWLRARPLPAATIADRLLAARFTGAHLAPADDVAVDAGPRLAIARARTMPAERVLDRAAFTSELTGLVREFASIQTAELEITEIDVTAGPEPQARTIVRFDLAGTAKDGWRAERVGRWRMRWQGGADGWRVVEWAALDQVRSRAAVPVFTEATRRAFGGNASFREQLVPGLDEWLTRLDSAFMPGGMGHHGASVGDADGDGLDDLYVAQPSGLPNRMFHNNGDGTFVDVTDAAGLAVLDSTSESLFADVDNDGDQDLVLVTRTEPLLFVNDGKGHFTRVPDAFQFTGRLRGSLTSAAMADFDRDGFLDLYLCAYSYLIGASEDKAGPPTPYHDAKNGPPSVLLRNDGHGRFVEVTAAAGLDEDNDRFAFAPAWGDYDEDGWPDLLVANDFGRKHLYHNEGLVNGQVRFKDVAGPAGVEDYGAGMSASFLDYDNDGHLDIYTGNMWTAAGQRITREPGFKPDAPPGIRELYQRHARGNSLFRNRGDGTFEDVTLQARAAFGRWAWSSDGIDFDNDGHEDLYVVNGMFTRDDDQTVDVDSFFWRQVVARTGTAYDDGWRATNRLLVAHGSQATHERNVLLRNDGHGGFDEISGTAGLDVDQDGRSFAVLDVDADGDPDLVLMAPRGSPQLRLFRNDFDAGHASIALRLIGTKSNRDAVGARVTVETDQGRFTKAVTLGSGFISQHSKELLFGLGGSQRIARVTIAWPSGGVETLTDVALNQRAWIREGDGVLRAEPFKKAGAPPEAPEAPRASEAGARARGTWLYQPYPAPDFTLRDLAGQEHSLSGLAGRPVLLLFWATSAPPSRAVLADLSRQRDQLARAGLSILALAVDAPRDEAAVRAAAQGIGVPVMMAGDAVAGTYSILHRYLFDRREDLALPTLFLVSGQGEIVKAYHDPVDVARLADDVPRIDVGATGERLARAVPFPGTFHAMPGERNDFQYGLELSEQGFDRPALVAFERVARVDPSAITFFNLGTLYMRLGQPANAKAALERALSADPAYADAHNTLGVLLAPGDIAGAVAHFRSAIASKPDDADAMNNLGYTLFQAGQREEALQLYQRALQLRPGFPEVLNNLGIFYGQQRDLARAETYFRQAVDRRPTYGEAANNLALVLHARGDTAAAITLLEHFVEASPAFEPAYITLSRLYVAAARPADARQVLARLLERNPAHPQALELLNKIPANP
jgi:Tfp pilus assembly protein PilF/peroxiredoxin